MARWIALGVGPWFYMEDVRPVEFRYLGRQARPPRFSMAAAHSGDVQLELIQQLDDAPSLYLDTLARNGECAQHVGYWTVDRFDDHSRYLQARGCIEGHAGRMAPTRGPFAYFVHPDEPSLMIEISEVTGGKAEFNEQVRVASIGWNGGDPIRRAGASRTIDPGRRAFDRP
jgi:hypothetical protein